MKKTCIIFAFLTTVLNMLPLFLLAQDPGGGPDAPIDGGLSILLAAGTAYGVKKYRDGVRRNKKEME